ncbi:hypothetical protein [Psychroflexus salis]|uniref:Uncharacterized protein n=1 Tax=Psychroflexus salis TaxID=1526574 RepID=A0A916ZWX9_9FLAO|nr:hypothetical protein [Psychroflexus salis]GGE16900.1 hypothetical protein GCM10010831_17730 [Psychroflexus salis]
MGVVIKELIIQGKINGNSTPTEEDLIKIIREEIKNNSKNTQLTQKNKNDLIEECKNSVLDALESKLRY